ncbi:MAG: peptidoglycan-binding protein [Candidatus Omnitrophica bacterium]|nr:peptidoglycan-binding protein [Candidatus Omnitrophota bacterium]
MGRICLGALLAGIFALSGCATTQSPRASQTVSASVVQEYQAKINSLEIERNRLKDENYILRKQLEAASRQEVRMPNATEIQTALKKAGMFKGMIDGKIGPETKEAIMKFQRANGITPDGVVGSKTWSLLSKYISG